MNRRTKIAAVAAAVLLTLGAGGVAVASADDAPAPAAASAVVSKSPVAEAAALTGTAKLYRPAPADDDITFTFDAHLAAKDVKDPKAATGTFRFSHYTQGKGGYALVKVDCLTTGGKVAVVTGRVIETDVPEFKDRRVGVSVHDMGRHDRLGYSWLAVDPEKEDVSPCSSPAPFERVKAGSGDFRVVPWAIPYN
ncbi:Repetin [Streptomyces venezuelae]|uniref:Repetin n=1 Tax=Streptomyces venezuelae TaxID=54571 RepID=UPI0012398C4E|nr:Repetin [Streptomyces venezuelae]QES05032.1 Repetin [Streptomyces venezuelae]